MAKKTIKYREKSFDISYDIINQTQSYTIVFLHGWGSYKEIMKNAFDKTLSEFRHIYIDMPGFGRSSNDMALTTYDYANIVQIFLDHFKTKNKKQIIAGHSFGGKVATLLAPDMLVLLSTAGIIEKKSVKTKLKIMIAKLFNIFGLSYITKLLRSDDVSSMSENMYKTFKNIVDEDFSDKFKNYGKPAMIFWGKEDKATSLNSGELIHKYIKDSKMSTYDGDHYFFLKHTQNIADKIKENFDKL